MLNPFTGFKYNIAFLKYRPKMYDTKEQDVLEMYKLPYVLEVDHIEYEAFLSTSYY